MSDRDPTRLAELLQEVLARLEGGGGPVIITGGIGAGKTTVALRLADALKERGIRIGGIVAPRVMEKGETVGYTIVDLTSGEERRFAGSTPPGIRFGRFFVSEEGLAFAARGLDRAVEREVAFVDELGRIELAGGGHAGSIRRILSSNPLPVLIVRDAFLKRAIERFSLKRPYVFPVGVPRERRRRKDENGREETLWEIVDSIRFPFLITRGRDGFPHARPMRLIKREESSFWFATSSGSAKVGELEADPRVALLFVDTPRFNYAIVRGRARLVDDPIRKENLWEEEWREDWPDGPTDPDYALLLIEGEDGFYHRGLTGESGGVSLRGVEPGTAPAVG